MKCNLWTTSVAVLTFACGDPGLGAENASVNSDPNFFRLQVTALERVSDVVEYTWVNDGTQASVGIGQFITGGGVTVTIRDADGTVVYQEAITGDIDTTTGAGLPGLWVVALEFRSASGGFTMTLRRGG